MDIICKYAIPRIFFQHWDKDGKEFGVLIVKADFHINENHFALLKEEQNSFIFDDIYWGDIGTSSLKYESELAPFKPKTDIMFNAIARSPNNEQCKYWQVGIKIDDLLFYQFSVFGKRVISSNQTPLGRSWQLSEIEPITEIPLQYEYAFGGTIACSEHEQNYCRYNPVGTGLLSNFILNQDNPIFAPQIGIFAELNNYKPGDELVVCGISPIAKGWYPRLNLAGTFDQKWQQQRHPLVPEDFDFNYWNAAPTVLQITPYLKGNETITAYGMFHEKQEYSFCLPGVQLICAIKIKNNVNIQIEKMNLDTVYCDISSDNFIKHSMTITWRKIFSYYEEIENININISRIINPNI
ncbi:DUF2169 domain-containing protein [Bartonella sp. HY329]|uniref:DUF2169 family type VI secretion system accessory protein n=1 Tax=unclassified Bartonella TaxID=2645622 RepID=UPI0021CA3451|nr:MULTISPECIES: DUF2169 domain-containing protein [unclassified Bartonella]UXM95245.1 DUF2169 domain-containing protein [Bartonella sp. HY329]UXN09569.1 DUF2169 domain-containing protein [Bartonella sp. HY328]